MGMAPGAPGADSDVPTIGTVESLPQDPTETAATTRPDPKAEDPVWKQVQAARFSQDRAKAILKFDEYARLHPDQFGSELTEYTEKVMDRIWFDRLEQLCKDAEALNRSIQQTDREISEETEDAYKKRVLLPLKEKYANRLQAVEEELKSEMKYDAPGAPQPARRRSSTGSAGSATRHFTRVGRTGSWRTSGGATASCRGDRNGFTLVSSTRPRRAFTVPGPLIVAGIPSRRPRHCAGRAGQSTSCRRPSAVSITTRG